MESNHDRAENDLKRKNSETRGALSPSVKTNKEGINVKESRSKSHPHVSYRNRLRYPSNGTIGSHLAASSHDNLRAISQYKNEDALERRKRLLRKFSTSISISKKFWNNILDGGDERSGMSHWSNLKSRLSLNKALVLQSVSENKDKRRILSPIRVRAAIRKTKLHALFKFSVRLTILCGRLAKAHSLRYREDDDDISPYIKGLTFHDYDNQPDLMFDKSKFKAKKSIRVPEETRRILCKRPSERTPQELYSALLTLRNIEAFAAYPNRMQKMIVSVGQYERFEAKRIVLRQGHPGSQYYFMLSGAAVVMVMDNPNSYARPIKHLEKGMDFGEIALTLNIKRQGTVITKEPCELMSIGRRDYRKIFMAGGVRSINDPDQEKFLSCLSFLRSWPIKLLEDAGDKTHFLFFRRGATIVKESALSPWIVVVKSGSISILKKLKRVVPFEWKKKKEVKFVTEKEKKDNYTKRNVLRRHILGELKIPLRQEVEEEDSSFEEYPGKYKMFVHPGDREEQDKASSPNLSQYSESSDNRLQTKSHDSTKKNSFPNIRSKFLTKISEDDSDNTLFGQMDKVPLPPFGIERESTSFDILAPIEPIKKKERSSRRESIMEKEREMMGFEEKTRTVQDDIDAVVKNPEDYTLADLKPEFVRVQTLIKGQVFGLSDLILEQKTSFSVVSNGADVILIDRQFYLKHAPEKLISQMRQELCPYPTDDDLQTRLQLNVDWDAYRNNTMANTLKHLSTKRQLRQSLKI